MPILALACLMSGSFAFALDEAASATSADTGLEEIVVTATKREENISKVPVSITAFTQDEMAVSGFHDVSDIGAVTPGVEFDTGAITGYAAGTLTNIAIRGVNSNVGYSTTGVYLDDTGIQGRVNPFSNFGMPFPFLFDLNRVEVARGPQGTLFGAGSEGGTIRFIFNQPSLQDFSGLAHAELASTEYGALSYETGVAAGGPIVSDRLGFRVSAWYRTDGGYIDRVDPFTGGTVDSNSNRTESKSARLALTGLITDGWTATPSIYYQDKQIADTSQYFNNLSDPGTGNFENGKLIPQASYDNFYLAALNIDGDMGPVKLTSISSYFSRDAFTTLDTTGIIGTDGAAFGLPLGNAGYGNPLGPAYPVSYADLSYQPNHTAQRVMTEELRFASSDPSARLTWTGGVFYAHSQQNETSNTYSALLAGVYELPANTSLLFEQTGSTDSQLAVFGQIDWAIIGGLKLTAGLRAAKEKYEFTTFAGGIFNTGIPAVSTASASENPTTPKAGISYQADENNLYYVTVSKGYRLGGGNSPLPPNCGQSAPATFGSDFVWNYEVGAKNKLFDNRLALDTNAFHMKWFNIQQDVLIGSCGGEYINNTGDATINGVDLSAEALLARGFRVDLALGYVDAHYSQNYTFSGVPVVQKGDALGVVPLVPSPWTVTLSTKYDFAVSGELTGYFWAQEIYHSQNNGPFANQIPGSVTYAPANLPNPPTYMLNTRLGAKWGAYDVSLFVDNVANAHPNLYKSTDNNDPASTLIYYSTFRPRTVGLSATYHF